jgi:hypothetical protein
MPKIISIYMDFKCPCGKKYSGEWKKVQKLITLHQKICSLSLSTMSVEPETLRISIDMKNPKSGCGELMRQQIQNGVI